MHPKTNTTFIKKTDLLPAHYTPVSEPVFTGKGNHSVSQLETICEQFKEFVHQQRIKEQTIIQKGNIEIVDQIPNCRTIDRHHMMSNNGPNCAFCGVNLLEEQKIRENKHEQL